MWDGFLGPGCFWWGWGDGRVWVGLGWFLPLGSGFWGGYINKFGSGWWVEEQGGRGKSWEHVQQNCLLVDRHTAMGW